MNSIHYTAWKQLGVGRLTTGRRPSERAGRSSAERDRARRRRRLPGLRLGGGVLLRALLRIEVDRRALELGAEEREPDRKSTRLNSSHVKITNAVICLNNKEK